MIFVLFQNFYGYLYMKNVTSKNNSEYNTVLGGRDAVEDYVIYDIIFNDNKH